MTSPELPRQQSKHFFRIARRRDVLPALLILLFFLLFLNGYNGQDQNSQFSISVYEYAEQSKHFRLIASNNTILSADISYQGFQFIIHPDTLYRYWSFSSFTFSCCRLSRRKKCHLDIFSYPPTLL